MKELHQITELEQARVLLNPIRIEILDMLRKPGVCADIAQHLDMSKQRVNNHLKELLQARLIYVVGETAKRHLIEKIYRSVAMHYWLSQNLTRTMDSADTKVLEEKMSLHNLLKMSEQLQNDAAFLLGKVGNQEIPSIGVTAEIRLRNEEERKAFTRDYLRVMHSLLEKYQGVGEVEQEYTAMLVCYPRVQKKLINETTKNLN